MLPDPVLDLLRTQHGLVADRQLQAQQPDKAARRAIHRHPDIRRDTPRVLRHLVSPPTIEQRLMRAVLDAGPGALLWGTSGAGHWGFTRFRRLPAHVGVRRTRIRGERAGQVHVLRHLDPRDVATHLDIPVARPELVILWLAAMWTHGFGHEIALERTAIALDQAWRQRLIHGAYLHDLADRSGGRGRSGIVVLRSVLEQRPPDYVAAGSRLEERFEELLPSRVASALDRQVTVDGEITVRTVDHLLRTWPLVVEINGEATHSSLTARRADEERYERLRELGFSVVIWWEHDIWYDGDTVRRVMHDLHQTPDAHPTIHRPTAAPWEL